MKDIPLLIWADVHAFQDDLTIINICPGILQVDPAGAQDVYKRQEYLILSCLLLPAVIPQVALGANSPISLHKASYRIIRCLWPTEAT